jgi:serine/threonine-protein kinase
MSAEDDRAPVSSEVSHPNSEPGQNAQHPPARQPPESFWGRVKRHKLVEWTLAYVAFGYALLHTVEMLGEAFEWPLLVPRLTVFGLVLGAPIAVTLAWYHGHRARQRVSGPELSILIVLLLVGGSVMWWLSRNSREHGAASAPAAIAHSAVSPASATASFNPPPHSIAVLPFVNMSGDKEQEYFSEGMTEELLNSLSRVGELQVAARTSSFSFQGEHPDIATVAHKLNVAAVLEGSVRRSAHTVRITAQLVNGRTGFHLWSQTYDRDLGDVLALQTEIATAVASALKVTLLGDEAAKIEIGGTRNPAAFDAYLRASRFEYSDPVAAIALYTEAIRLDPNYALAFAHRSLASTGHAEDINEHSKDAVSRADDERALADARRTIALAPDLAEGHLALAFIFEDRALDFARTKAELERALALAPGNALVLGWYGRFAVMTGRTDIGIGAVRRAVMLDPLNYMSHYRLGQSLYRARRYEEAVAAWNEAMTLGSQDDEIPGLRGLAYYGLGDLQNARASCEAGRDDRVSQWCLAVTYHKLARYADANAVLATLRAAAGDRWSYECAAIYAQWGNTSQALGSLESAWRLRVPELRWLKTEPLMDPLRKEPRFQAVMRELKFPE